MQALVIHERYDPPELLSELRQELEEKNVTLFQANSIHQAFTVIKHKLQKNEPFLFYRTSGVRLDDPVGLLNFHKENGFDSLMIGEEPVTYDTSNVMIYRNQLLNKSELATFSKNIFTVSNCTFEVKKPNIDPPIIFALAHNRSQYFQLTLNAILHSIDDTVPLAVILSEPTKEVEEIALSVKNRPNTSILKIKDNAYIGIVNLALQWFRPKKFIVLEDDFILPSTAKEIYPNWVYHFSHRLEYFDMVGWGVTTDNAPLYHRMDLNFNLSQNGWAYGKGRKKFIDNPILLGQCLALKYDFWKECAKKLNKPYPNDSEYHWYAKSYCLPSLRGYHIGWNQYMDGFEKVIKRNIPNPPSENEMIDIKTGEVRKFNMEGIYGGA